MRYLVEFTVPDEDGGLRDEVGESIEPGVDTTLLEEDNEEEDAEGMEVFAWEGRVCVSVLSLSMKMIILVSCLMILKFTIWCKWHIQLVHVNAGGGVCGDDNAD